MGVEIFFLDSSDDVYPVCDIVISFISTFLTFFFSLNFVALSNAMIAVTCVNSVRLSHWNPSTIIVTLVDRVITTMEGDGNM